ncbi:MAG: hypothetical protein GY816_08240 [Cytophagales bacterium]|nr:hypothetical protein [Cytophagales bacterium]
MVFLTQCRSGDSNVQQLTEKWEIVIPNQKIPEGLTSIRASDCGTCHKKHYEEWKLSTHALAWVDLQFQAELKKESSPFFCINCHIPLQNQQEFIVKGMIDGDIYQPVKVQNPKFDKELQKEGITCASCHVRDGAIIGPTGTSKAPHKTVKNPAHLSEELCTSCHNANAVVTPTLACTFETGDEWKAGPYFEEKNCISCHMEPINREIVDGNGERLSHFHFFGGSGIPKFDSVTTKILNGLAFYPSTLKETYFLTDEIIYSLKLKNEFAGHNVPTGDPERFFQVQFELKNKLGEIISTQTERIGEKWEWYPVAKKIADNNMLPNEERVFAFSYVPDEKGEHTLSVTVTKNRMDKKTAEYNKLGDNYPLFITIYEEEHVFQVQ